MKIRHIGKNIWVEDESGKSTIASAITLLLLFVLFYLIDSGYIVL